MGRHNRTSIVARNMCYYFISLVMQDCVKTHLDACTSIDSRIATVAFIDENIITWLGSRSSTEVKSAHFMLFDFDPIKRSSRLSVVGRITRKVG